MAVRFKRVFRLYFVWQEEREEQWLNAMAKKGWLLTGYFFGFYTFKSAEPGDYIYKFDYKSTGNADLDEYLAIFEDAGWEHAAQFFGWHYFRTPAEGCLVPDIYSDTASKVQKYRGLQRVLGIVAITQLPLLLNHLLHSRSLLVAALVLTSVALVVYALVRVSVRIRALQEKM